MKELLPTCVRVPLRAGFRRSGGSFNLRTMPNRLCRRVFAGLAVLVIASLAPIPAASPLRAQIPSLQSFEKSSLEVRSAKGSHKFSVELAVTEAQHSQGLMFRRHLAPDAGMLFLYRQAQVARFWMKNTYVPLDMLFIAADGRIRSIAERTVPLSLETVSSDGVVIAVLELNAGTAARLGIRPGDRVIHPSLGTGG